MNMHVTGVRRGDFPEFSDLPHIDARFPRRHSRPRLNVWFHSRTMQNNNEMGKVEFAQKKGAGSAVDIETMIHALFNLVVAKFGVTQCAATCTLICSNCAPRIGLKT